MAVDIQQTLHKFSLNDNVLSPEFLKLILENSWLVLVAYTKEGFPPTRGRICFGSLVEMVGPDTLAKVYRCNTKSTNQSPKVKLIGLVLRGGGDEQDEEEEAVVVVVGGRGGEGAVW